MRNNYTQKRCRFHASVRRNLSFYLYSFEYIMRGVECFIIFPVTRKRISIDKTSLYIKKKKKNHRHKIRRDDVASCRNGNNNHVRNAQSNKSLKRRGNITCYLLSRSSGRKISRPFSTESFCLLYCDGVMRATRFF